MPQITGGDAVYYALKAAGVECLFGIPSQHNLGIYDALQRHGGIRVIGSRHEQGAVHAADGYARASGRLGVAIVLARAKDSSTRPNSNWPCCAR